MRALVLLAAVALGCTAAPPATPKEDGAKSDWSQFGSRGGVNGAETIRGVPEEPVGITGVPYLRSLKLAWTIEEQVPTFEARNETRELPDGALQAVLRVDLKSLPEGARLRVEWYFGDVLAFSDEKRDDRIGPHDFALVKEERGHLVPLPPGRYRADLFDGSTHLKSIPFEVVESR